MFSLITGRHIGGPLWSTNMAPPYKTLLSANEVKNKWSLFGRPLEQKKNGVFVCEILLLIRETFKFFFKKKLVTSSVNTRCAVAMATVLLPDEVCAELMFPFFVISCLRNHKVETRYVVVDFVSLIDNQENWWRETSHAKPNEKNSKHKTSKGPNRSRFQNIKSPTVNTAG